uniref:LamG-like jellyroll fold domain-containing protein n=2 Tax=Clytia hemisphaerica TaxID=252671 RepID=A0A7M5UHS1_9CNID
MTQGGEILKFSDEDYTCSQGARLWEAAINFKGDTFQAKPRTAITVAAWVRLEKRQGQHSIFDTVGVSHPKGQYHFEVNNGIVRWFHRDQTEKVVFETMAHTVEKGKWTHLAGTYDSKTKQAKIFINGEIRNQSIGDGLLSRDWSVHAGISNMLKCRPLQGSIDEFRIYNYALTPDEIKALVSACKAPDAAASTKTLSAETTDKAEARSETPKENESDSTSDKKTERKRRSLIDLTIRRLNFT